MMRKMRARGRPLLLVGGSLFLLSAGVVAMWAASLKIPDVASLSERKVEQSTKIYDRTGTVLLDDLHESVSRTVVPIEDVSRHIKNATVAIEDAEFYQHRGIKFSSIIRAVLVNLFSLGYEQGGSTITQQVVKNSILTKDKTLTRKVKEWVLSLKLEQVLPKDKILELYLNETPYGGAIYGIEEAAQTYLGKHARDVSLAEAAYLAAMPQAPTYFSPYGNHREALDARKNLVLSRMRELGFITEAEYNEAKDTTVSFEIQATSGIRAPHFVFFVREQLEKEFGSSVLEQSGWRIITTLDADLEARAEEIVAKGALENVERVHAENAGLVAIDPQTGDILAMVGSRGYFDPEIDGAYNVAVAKRQPGSSFKPFVYARAFSMGYSPDTVLFDTATQFSSECPVDSLSDKPPCYAPQNYDHRFRGPMTLRDALGQSINVVAIKTLYLVGIQNAINLAHAMGITTLEDANRYGLTLVLGGGEVTLLDMTSAYGVFANEGVRNPHRAILRIEDRNGTEIKTYPTSPQKVLDANVALTMSDVLSDNVARTPIFGPRSPLYFSNHYVAGKTGTTNDSRDAWVVGYTPTFVAGMWAGNNDNTPMADEAAGFIVAPMWHEFMLYALTKYPDSPFPQATPIVSTADKPVLRGIWEGGEIVTVDAQTGNPVPADFAGLTKERVTVAVHSILYWLSKNDPRGPRPTNPNDDPQFMRWEWGVRNWTTANGYTDGAVIFK